MPSVRNDERVLKAVFERKLAAVKAAGLAGASANGPPDTHFPPITAASIDNHIGMVEFFLEKGADPDKPIATGRPFQRLGSGGALPGERALQIAATRGNVEIVSLLLKRSHADPNATDHKGCTSLMVVRLLLEAGADPTLAEANGILPLHAAAVKGNVDLVHMLYSSAPRTLNRCTSDDTTPLFEACKAGQETIVSTLLSLGATQPLLLDNRDVCTLVVAVKKGFVSVVQVFINEGGMRAVGGRISLHRVMFTAVGHRRARILRLLLRADGEMNRWETPSNSLKGLQLLRYSAAWRYPAAVSILLNAGVDDMAGNEDGDTPLDVINMFRDPDLQSYMGNAVEQWEVVAIYRMLQRGPAYRARSWTWPSDEGTDACDGYDSCDSDNAAAATPVLSSPSAVPHGPVDCLRIFRPRHNSRSSNAFVGLMARYCAKASQFIFSDVQERA